jgi:hypothetical protein
MSSAKKIFIVVASPLHCFLFIIISVIVIDWFFHSGTSSIHVLLLVVAIVLFIVDGCIAFVWLAHPLFVWLERSIEERDLRVAVVGQGQRRQ